MATTTDQQLLELVRDRTHKAGVFGDITLDADGLNCAAAASAEPASYRLRPLDGGWEVSLVTEDRWLSESIEADLMHTGDPLEELIEEELVELGFNGATPTVKHFRSEELLYTFCSLVEIRPNHDPAEEATTWLLAYEAAFRELGDMEDDGEDN